ATARRPRPPHPRFALELLRRERAVPHGDDLVRAHPVRRSRSPQAPAASSSTAVRTPPAATMMVRCTGTAGAAGPARSVAISVATDPCGVAIAPTARPIDVA